MSAEGLAGLGAETDTEATILRLAPTNSGPAAPVAFLIHGGTVPVEVSRDVVIGRDPDARALIDSHAAGGAGLRACPTCLYGGFSRATDTGKGALPRVCKDNHTRARLEVT